MKEKQPPLIGSDGELLVAAKVEKPGLNRRLIGSDGELLVPIKVEKSKRQPDDSSLNRRLVWLVTVLILILGGGALVVFNIQASISAPVPSEQPIVTYPIQFNKNPYELALNVAMDMKTPVKLPCPSRRIQVKVQGRTPVTVRIWAVPDHGSVDMQASMSATERTLIFDILAQHGDMFHMAVIDSQSNVISGVEAITFGTTKFPFCELGMTFKTSRG